MTLDPLSFGILFTFGAIGGILAGLLGIGGGIIYVFVLDHYLRQYGLSDEEVVRFILSNSIVATFFAGISGTIKLIRKKYFFPREILYTGSAGVLSSLAVTWSIVEWHWYSKEKFTLFFLAVLIIFAVNILRRKKPKVQPADLPVEHHHTFMGKPHHYFLTGIATGVMSAMSGLGGGIILIPILTAVTKIDIRKASAISLGIIPMQALTMGTFYALSSKQGSIEVPHSLGYVVLPIIIPMLLGVILCTPLGVKMAHKFRQQTIKYVFGGVVLFIFVKTLFDYISGKV